MTLPIASLDPVLATLILSGLVLLAGTVLSVMALRWSKNADAAKQVFAVVGVLFGLLAAGGLGTLFASQNAETAENAAESAGTTAASKVSSEVSEQVGEALATPPAEKKGK